MINEGEKFMKILYIDPWCSDGSNLYYYSTGLVEAMSDYADIVMVTQANCSFLSNARCKIVKLFFAKSSKMHTGIIRTIVRGLEYIVSYLRIIKFVKNSNFDVIHVEWSLMYKIDPTIFKQLKKSCKIFSFKAHNILPHSTGDKYIMDFKKIYSIPEIIIVHGEKMKEDFYRYYPEYVGKIKIQHDGVLANFSCEFSEEGVDQNIISAINLSKRVYLFVGRIDQDKGIDRFVEIWRGCMDNSQSLLIVAGKPENGFDYNGLKSSSEQCANIILIDEYIPDNLLNYLIHNSDIVVIPYVKGSMSAVAITAAEFSKPVFSTKFGVIEEYVRDKIDGFVVDNDKNSIQKMLVYLEKKISNDVLARMGHSFNTHLNEEFNWKAIGKKLIFETYMPMISN